MTDDATRGLIHNLVASLPGEQRLRIACLLLTDGGVGQARAMYEFVVGAPQHQMREPSAPINVILRSPQSGCEGADATKPENPADLSTGQAEAVERTAEGERRGWTPQEDALVAERRAQGVTWQSIADELGRPSPQACQVRFSKTKKLREQGRAQKVDGPVVIETPIQPAGLVRRA